MTSPCAESWSKTTTKSLDQILPPTSADLYANKPLPLLPGAETSKKKLEINEDIDKFTLTEVALRLGNLFNHIPFAISGIAALALDPSHQFPLPITHVSIITPPECVRAIKCWATACGLQTLTSVPCGFGIKTSDGRTCLVRIKKCTESFSSLDVRYIGDLSAPILTLKAVANRIAKCYIADLSSTEPFSHLSQTRQLTCASNMRWVLNKMISKRSKFRRDSPPVYILDKQFWDPFTTAFPDTVWLFARAGILIEDGESSMIAYSLSDPAKKVNRFTSVKKLGKVSDASLQNRDVMSMLSAKILGLRLLKERSARQKAAETKYQFAPETSQDTKQELAPEKTHCTVQQVQQTQTQGKVPNVYAQGQRRRELLERFGVTKGGRKPFQRIGHDYAV